MKSGLSMVVVFFSIIILTKLACYILGLDIGDDGKVATLLVAGILAYRYLLKSYDYI